MSLNPRIFRAYDIRGVVGIDFETQDAELVGKAFGSRIQEIHGPRVVVGHDNRFTSDELNDYFIQGLLSTGCHVVDVGLSLTPLIHWAVLKKEFDGGVMVTGSHNRKEVNGFRFDLRGALPFHGEELLKLKQIIQKEKFKKGKGEIEYWGALYPEYEVDIKSRVRLKKPLKVVIDCGNSTPSVFAPRLFKNLGCEVVKIHCHLHGEYPYHSPDPEERVNMKDAQKGALETSADLGLGFDADGDRFGVIDEKGEVYDNDMVMIVLSDEILKKHPGSRVLFDIKSSYVLSNEIQKRGGIPQMMRTGHPYFREEMLKEDIFLGGEVSSHTFIKDNYYGFDDGLYAAARVLEILSKVSYPFSKFFEKVEKTARTEELKAPCPDEKKFEIVEELKAKFRQQWGTIEIDGVRILFSPSAWALVRASNTSPRLSLRFEAENEERLKEIMEIVISRLEQYPVVDISGLRKLVDN